MEWKRPSMVSGYVLNVKKQHHSSFVGRMKHAHNTVNKYRQNIDHTNKWQTQEPYYTEVLERQTRDSSRRSGKLLVEVHAIIRSLLYWARVWCELSTQVAYSRYLLRDCAVVSGSLHCLLCSVLYTGTAISLLFSLVLTLNKKQKTF